MRLLALPLLALAAVAAHAQAPSPGDVVVNEVMWDPPAPQPSTNEWVEVVNRSGASVDLAGLTVSDAGSTSDAAPGPLVVEPGGFVVFVRNADAFAAAYPGVPFVVLGGFPSLNNTGDRVALAIGGTVLDAIDYTPAWGGADASLERRDPAGPSTQPNFGTSTAAGGATPGATNSLFAPDTTPPGLSEAEATDATTVLVTFDEPVDEATAEATANYAIDGGVGAPAAAARQPDPTQVMLTLAAPLAGPATYTLTVMGVRDRAGNAMAAESASFFFGEGAVPAARDLVVNEFLYDEPTEDNPGEYVELFNRTDRSFDLREFTLNDGTGDDTAVTTEAVFVGPGEYAVIVEDGALFAAVFPGVPFVEQPAWSALNNTGDAVVLRYQGTAIDSLVYRTSWGGVDVSLERKDPAGPSSVAVNWASTTDPRGGTPGARNAQFAPDVAGPRLVSAAPSRDGRAVTLVVDEPLDPASVSASAFAITGGPAVTAAAYAEADPSVTLTLAGPLATGASTVTATGLRDGLGNTTAATSTTVTFTPDTVLPAIARATATDATTVRVEFTETVTAASAGAPSAYSIDSGSDPLVPTSVATEAQGDGVGAAVLTFAAALPERQILTLRVAGLRDLAGNVQPSATARLFLGAADAAGPGDLAITEIMYDPQNGSDGEYLEVFNTTDDRIFDIRDLSLDDDPLADEAALVLPGEYLALVRDGEAFQAVFPDAPFVEVGSAVSLSNSGEAVVLRAGGLVVDSVAYDPAWHRVELDDATGIALERRDPRGPSSAASNWSSSLDGERGGTPSAENTLRIAGPPVERDGGITIESSPFSPADGEAARITYTLAAEAALVRARIFDGGGRPVRELEPGRLSGSEATLTWDGTGDDRQRLRAGIYVVLIEAVDAQGGTTEAHRAAIVLARR